MARSWREREENKERGVGGGRGEEGSFFVTPYPTPFFFFFCSLLLALSTLSECLEKVSIQPNNKRLGILFQGFIWFIQINVFWMSRKTYGNITCHFPMMYDRIVYLHHGKHNLGLVSKTARISVHISGQEPYSV